MNQERPENFNELVAKTKRTLAKIREIQQKPPKPELMKAALKAQAMVVNTIRISVEKGWFTLEDIGTNETELVSFEQKGPD